MLSSLIKWFLNKDPEFCDDCVNKRNERCLKSRKLYNSKHFDSDDYFCCSSVRNIIGSVKYCKNYQSKYEMEQDK